MTRTTFRHGSSGLLAGISAFVLWGVLVLFWRLLDAVSPFEILCYRIVCSFIVLLPLVLLTRRWHEVCQACYEGRTFLTMLGSALVVGCNWFLYIWAISQGRVLEASLGYYITPLLNVLLGMVIFQERPSRLQLFAIGLAFVGVLWSLWNYGSLPWLALALGSSFALYGIIRKTVRVEALPGLFLETAFLSPLAGGWLVWLYAQGQGFLADPSLGLGALLFISGPVTSLPLGLFAYAARHMQLTTLGLLQYLSPTSTFLIGLFVFREPLTPSMLVMFVCIWVALALYSGESLRLARQIRRCQ